MIVGEPRADEAKNDGSSDDDPRAVSIDQPDTTGKVNYSTLCEAYGDITEEEAADSQALIVFSKKEKGIYSNWRDKALEYSNTQYCLPNTDGSWKICSIQEAQGGDKWNNIHLVRVPNDYMTPIDYISQDYKDYKGTTVAQCPSCTPTSGTLQMDPDKTKTTAQPYGGEDVANAMGLCHGALSRLEDLINHHWETTIATRPPKVVMQPTAVEGGWIFYRGINSRGMTRTQPFTRLGFDGGLLQASRLAVYAERV